ncbi:GPW/gp25 family protein [Alcaligenaceae bacterium]|nr:GPW/gp25 family protein [Alcaligenaceae bacterium]
MALESHIPTAAHWQPALRRPGEVVLGVDDIAQAIRIILSTPLGSDPHRPDFGSRINDYIDWPVNRARPHLVRESVDAIRRWETRVDLVSVRIDVENEHIVIGVIWRVADGVERLTEVRHARFAAA